MQDASTTDLPQAAAYFPLTGGNLLSEFPAGAYEGEAHNVLWDDDPEFGQVISCSEVRRQAGWLADRRALADCGQEGALGCVLWDDDPGVASWQQAGAVAVAECVRRWQRCGSARGSCAACASVCSPPLLRP